MQTARTVLVVLADGFEELEALAPVDVLRRCGAHVTIAGVGALQIRGSHGIPVVCDALLSDVFNTAFDAIVFPGGMPGAKNLHESEQVSSCILDTYARGALVCAICASPAFVLGPLGILEGRKATCYPGCEVASPSVGFCSERVVHDGNVITAIGPGAAVEFGLEIARSLFGDVTSSEVASDMIVC